MSSHASSPPPDRSPDLHINPSSVPAPLPTLVPDDIKAPECILTLVCPPSNESVDDLLQRRWPVTTVQNTWALPPGLRIEDVTQLKQQDGIMDGVRLKDGRPCYDVIAWFSCDEPEPDEGDDFFHDFKVPHGTVCLALDSALARALKGGYRSIRHPSDAARRLPLYAVRVWKWACNLLRKIKMWQRCFAWVEEKAAAEAWAEVLFDTVQSVIRQLPHTGRVPGLHDGVGYETLVPDFLSDRMLADDSMDAALTAIERDTPADPDSDTVITGARFSSTLDPANAGILAEDDFLAATDTTSRFKDAEYIVIPWNLNLHWMHVLVQRTDDGGVISVADSILDGTSRRVRTIVAHLKPWLEEHGMGSAWTVETGVISILQQQDSTTCGPAVLNSEDNRRSGGQAGVWSPEKPGALRANCLLRCLALGTTTAIVSARVDKLAYD
jgi:hypothetical protein